jgi:hypothetical protein
MRRSVSRAGLAALALVLVLAPETAPLVRAEEGRVYTAQSEADLKKRADWIMKSITDAAEGVKATYGSVDKGAGPNGVVIKNVEITTPENKKLTIEQIEVRDLDWSNPEESKVGDFSVRKLSIPIAELNDEPIELGMTSLTINAEYKYTFDEEKKSLDVTSMSIDIAELMELHIKFKLVGLSLAETKVLRERKGKFDKKDEEAMTKVLAKVSLVSSVIAIKDKSLVERIVRMGAKKDKTSEAQARAKILDMLAQQHKEADDEAMKEFIDAAIKFVTKPGTIELEANPPQPVNLMAAFASGVASLTAVKQMLGLKITVK